MRYLTGILVIFSLCLVQSASASGPGYETPLYDLDFPNKSHHTPEMEEKSNIESIRRPANNPERRKPQKSQTNRATAKIGALSLKCHTTPSLEQVHVTFKPIKKSNNLIRKPGSALRAKGQYVVLQGQVLDKDCLPISDAVIQIWQTDTAGKYLEAYDLVNDWDTMDPDYDKNFAYSGSTQTNNLGEYSFVTVLPNSTDENLAPHINMNIKHADFEDIKTMVYFNKHPKNEKDANLSQLNDVAQSRLLAKGKPIDPSGKLQGREYNLNITMEGINKFRRY